MMDLLTEMDWVPELRSEALTHFFKVITALGSNWFAALFLASGLLLWRKAPFLRLIIACSFSEILNAHLKAVYMFPRPDPSFHLVDVSSLSFPSGHAQHGTVMWLWLAGERVKTPAWIGGAFLALSIALSRLYLGVHYGRDIVAGIVAGVAMLVYFRWLFTSRETGSERPQLMAQLSFVISLQLIWMALVPEGRYGNIFLPSIIFIGFLAGTHLERDQATTRRSMLWGGIGATALVFGMGLLTELGGAPSWRGPLGLGTHPIVVVIQFTLLGFWMGWMAPIVFKRLKIRDELRGGSTVDGVDR
jgi:membrane-associated phospholipid phosphatase